MDNNSNKNLSYNIKTSKEKKTEDIDELNYELSFYDEDDFFDVDDWLYEDGEDFLED